MTSEDSRISRDAASGTNRLRLVVEYDGTDFAGFQWQADERTVQGELEAAVAKLGKSGGEILRIHGAGRTDAGVHATGQVVHFDPTWTVPVDRVAIALNGILPRDLVVRKVEEADATFHSRFNATARIYRYVILNRATPSALLNRYALYIREPLRLDAMRNAAQELTGVQDFASFGQPDEAGKSTVRDVTAITLRAHRDSVFVTVKGNAFLRQMVRCLVGTLVRVGQGKLDRTDVQAIREARNRMACPFVAPARGLCLVRVSYEGTRWVQAVQNRTSQNENTTDI